MSENNNIKKFYDVDGVDYGYRRWRQNPIARFDYDWTKVTVSNYLKYLHVKSALEVGCGPGTWTGILKEHAEKVIAVDISEIMIKQARKANRNSKIQYVVSDIMNFLTEEKFDLIFSIRAFEYVKEKKLFLDKCYEMLNPNGKIFIITKTQGSYWYGRTKIRKLLKKIFPPLFYYENHQILTRKSKENISYFWQERSFVKKFIFLLKSSGFYNFTVRPVIIRPPIFMRGKTEIPIIPPLLEKPILGIFKIINRAFSDYPCFTIFAESYLVVGEKE